MGAERRVKAAACYDEHWRPLHFPVLLSDREALRADPPRCADEMCAAARRLGAAYGTFVRIDLYAGSRGCVFGEFTPTPRLGRGYTDDAEEYLGDCWQRFLGDAL